VSTTKLLERPARKRASKKTALTTLSACPVDGAGWCPYPFSPAQLERHLRQKMAAQAAEVKTGKPAGKTRKVK